MALPHIDEANRNKPLCLDPARGKFILFEELVARREEAVPVESLSEADLKRLVIERLRQGPDFRMQALSGGVQGRDELIHAIEADEPFGRMTVEAEKAYLQDLLAQIRGELGD